MADIKKERMNGDDQIIRKGKEVLAIEGNAVLGLVDKVNGDFARAIKSIGKSRGRVVFTGMGKSGKTFNFYYFRTLIS